MLSPELALVLALAAGCAAVAAMAVAVRRGRRLERLEQRPLRTAAGSGGATAQSLTREGLERLTEQAGIGLVHVAPDGRIDEANGAAHRHLGRAGGALVGESPIGAFLDHRVDSLLGRVATAGAAELDLALPGEPQRTLQLRAERDGTGRGAWIVILDVSELRRLRRIRTEFIDNLSHELRTPLTTVRLLSEVLSAEAEKSELPVRVRDSIAKIDVETGHLVQMVTELLDLARIEHGETPLRRAPVDLGAVVEDVIGRLRPYADRQGVALRGEVPGTAGERIVDGDAERLGQLLLNLLHNAIKLSEPAAEVAVRLRASGDGLRLEVQDHGPGIPRRDLERIFERFYKVDRSRARSEDEPFGAGLGLAIVRHIVEAHGGVVGLHSRVGAGSTFWIDLPRV